MMQKLSKKTIIITTIITIVILVGIIATSAAVWTASFTQTGTNTYTYDCFNVTFTDTNEGVGNVGNYPVSDAAGWQTTPYTFTIENTCSSPATYNIIINKLSTSTLSDAYIKVGYENTTYLLSELKTSDVKTSDASIGKILTTGVLNGGASKSFSLYAWIAENAEIEQKDKSFSFKVSLSATAGNNITEETRPTLTQTLKDNNPLQTSTPNFAYGAPNTTLTSNASGLFSAADDLGTSYYFRGNITNNYVSFGGFIWRVVRINGDGTIRLIYDGTTAHTNGEDSTDRYVGTSAFNTSYYNPKYVGYTYDNTYDENGFVTRGTASDMKTYLDDWYQTNIVDNNLDGYVAESIYCNDTTTSSTSGSETDYGAYGRNYKTSGNAPILTCPTTDKDYGGKYKLKVGLLSTDEMVMAGLGYSDSSSYYATTDNYIYLNTLWYSMSPRSYITSSGFMSYGYQGRINDINTTSARAVRPVINLRTDTLITQGDGTQSSPYEVAY